jgi:hypothetical protein
VVLKLGNDPADFESHKIRESFRAELEEDRKDAAENRKIEFDAEVETGESSEDNKEENKEEKKEVDTKGGNEEAGGNNGPNKEKEGDHNKAKSPAAGLTDSVTAAGGENNAVENNAEENIAEENKLAIISEMGDSEGVGGVGISVSKEGSHNLADEAAWDPTDVERVLALPPKSYRFKIDLVSFSYHFHYSRVSNKTALCVPKCAFNTLTNFEKLSR